MYAVCPSTSRRRITDSQDDDLEVYRTILKKEVKDWHSSIITKKNSEWLILQIVRPPDPSRAASRNVFRLQGTVQSKLKADFNGDDRDRYAHDAESIHVADV